MHDKKRGLDFGERPSVNRDDYSEPMPAEAFTDMLRRQRQHVAV